MNRTEAIRHRRSVRTFDGAPVREEDREKIMRFAEAAESPYGIPVSWRLLNAGEDGLSSPVITGTETYIAGKMARVPHAEEAFGFLFESILLYAETLGMGSTWIAGTMDRAAFERAMGLTGDEILPCVSPLGYPAQKMSFRETMMRKGIRADTRMDFGALFFSGDFLTPLSPEQSGRLRLPLELVRLAPSAVNRQPWRAVVCGDRVHFFEKHSRGYAGGGWDLQKIDIGIALCHFAAGAEENGMRLSLLLEDPGIPAPQGTEYVATYAFS